MPHEYKLRMIIEETSEEITMSGQFSDDDWKLLEAFEQYAEELSNTKFMQAEDWGTLNIHGEHDSMKITTKLPQWDEVIVFLHKFRPLLLQSESTNFYKICNILAKELNHPHFNNLLGQYHNLYSGKTLQSVFRIRLNNVLINSEKILLDWLNSYEYHRNKEKQEYIDGLHRMMPLDASKVIFLRLLDCKAQGVFGLAVLIRLVLGKQKTINMTLRQP